MTFANVFLWAREMCDLHQMVWITQKMRTEEDVLGWDVVEEDKLEKQWQIDGQLFVQLSLSHSFSLTLFGGEACDIEWVQ